MTTEKLAAFGIIFIGILAAFIVVGIIKFALRPLFFYIFDKAARVWERLHDTKRKLQLLVRVLHTAAEWAKAERALRDYSNPRSALCTVDNEQWHRIVLQSEVTEQRLLDAVENARSEGLNLSRFSIWN